MKQKETVWEALYCSCIHESSSATISIHKTKQGAEKAIKEHRDKELAEFNELFKSSNDFGIKFGEHESWNIVETEIFE